MECESSELYWQSDNIRCSFRIESKSPAFIAELEKIQLAGGNWTQAWIERCLKDFCFQEKINEKIEELRKEGWEVSTQNYDNHGYGLDINFIVKKSSE